MATLVNEATSILQKLDEEAGTNVYWTESEIKSWYNDLYIETSRQGKFIRKSETQDSIAEQDSYVLPDKTIEVLSVVYDNVPLTPTTILELNAYLYTWRSEASGIPDYYYFAEGERFTKIRLWKTPSESAKDIELTVAYIPDELEDSDEPEMPFNNSKTLFFGVMAMSLWKAGAGQDIERGNYYWSLFQNALMSITGETKTEQKSKTHVFRSIHDVGLSESGSALPSNYPRYNFRR